MAPNLNFIIRLLWNQTFFVPTRMTMILSITSDNFDENIVTLLKEPWVLIHLRENTTFLSDDNKGRQTQFQKNALQTWIFFKKISLKEKKRIECDLFWCERPLVAKRFQIIKTCFTEVAIRSAAIISYLLKHKAKDK